MDVKNCHSPLLHFPWCTSFAPPPPPKFCITFVFHFSCVLQPSQEKLNTMLMQNVYWGLGGGGGANKVHYGKCGNGEVQKYNSFPCSVLLSTIEMTSNCSKLCRETIRLICKHFDLNSMVKSMENCCRMVNPFQVSKSRLLALQV